MSRTWEEAKRLVDEKKNPEEQLEVFLQDIWDKNEVDKDYQFPLFWGKITKFNSGAYAITDLKTITDKSLTNPYDESALRAYIGYDCKFEDGNVVCFVRVSESRKNERELLVADNNSIFLFERGNNNIILPEQVAQRIIDMDIAPNYREKLLTVIAKCKWPDDYNSFVKQKTDWEKQKKGLEDEYQNALKRKNDASQSAQNAEAEEKEATVRKENAEEAAKSAEKEASRITDELRTLRKHYTTVFPEQYDKAYLEFPQLGITTPSDLETLLQRLEYVYDQNQVITFLMALTTSQIIALCGEPGTGKTTFARQMANALGAKFHLIEVQNNWTDRSDILGFYNPTNGSYQSTAFIDALIEARDDYNDNKNNSRIHIICLDEMNLARVEYYFATFLSLLQQAPDERIIDMLPWEAKKSKEDGLFRYKDVFIPPNVRFVGTMNMDDTAQNLSPKVIDRCIFIEFSESAVAEENPEYSLSDAYFPESCFSEVWSPSAKQEIDQELSRISADPKKDESGFIAGPRLRKYAKCMWPLYHLLMPERSLNAYIDLLLCRKILPSIHSVSQASKIGTEFPMASERFQAGQARGKRLHPYDAESWSYWE